MAVYIERTEELMLAMNAGARAIENTKHYHGSSYCKDPFSGNPKEISYLRAAEALREASEAPAADVASVVRCGECRSHHWHQEPCHGKTVHTCDVLDAEVTRDFFCGYGERKVGGLNG